MAKKYDVVATLGTYERDGEKKYISRNVGSVIQTQKGFRLALEATFNPAGCRVEEDGKVWLALFEPTPRGENNGQGQMNRNQGSSDPQGGFGGPMNDEVPFHMSWK